VKAALAHLDTTDQSEHVVDAIRATVTDTDEDIAKMAADEAMTRRASTCSAPRATTPTGRWLRCRRISKPGGRTCWRAIPTSWRRTSCLPPPMQQGLPSNRRAHKKVNAPIIKLDLAWVPRLKRQRQKGSLRANDLHASRRSSSAISRRVLM
jgi:hypothetical protein